MNPIERSLTKKFSDLSSDVAPGFRVMVAQKGKVVADCAWGKTWAYYDLASLTKIIFTATQFMILESQKKVVANDKVSRYLPWYKPSASIADLLAHVAGNEWWRPFYKELLPLETNYDKRQKLRLMIRDLNLKKQNLAVYSDIDFLVLGFILEQVRETSLENIWIQFQESNLPNSKLHFNSGNTPKFARASYAPTEKCLWRKKIIQGEAHDDNTWALGGVSSHAGLFGRPEDVLQWGLWLRQAHKTDTPTTKALVVEKYLKRAIPERRGDWSLGFMMPTRGKASCGPHFDLKSVGHTGFTGTSFWWDIKKDVMVVLLSNRTFPTRENELFRKERPHIHNIIMETLSESQL